MKIAVVSDDTKTVSEHFSRAPYYVVLAVEGNKIATAELRPKAGHHTFARQRHHPEPGPAERHGYGPVSEAKHQAMADTIADCRALIVGGMGRGAFESLRARGIEPVVTDVRDIREAALRHARGDLPNLIERLH